MVILTAAEEDAILPLLVHFGDRLPAGPVYDAASSALEKLKAAAMARLQAHRLVQASTTQPPPA
jgi:hypothetical protein